ncbi:dTDP-4-dehydrorhamnose 3,5-epimerase [Neobacillus sp. YIM B06451]|uniref:dTDP-4-dehydrorhamnose 3,5-epimerase n=1 Tax=Neobacillus sp. YIM B06451 TaxID=3070994 RepID=UPI00292E58C8|nr:dTDP-4-dehydrorhamnose 3,5-epimerase [Neobacillus sp. YIM B06451]
MNLIETRLQGVVIVEPNLFGDHRGWFMETYSDAIFKRAGIEVRFIQDNHSFSASKGTLRGLHYQLNPKAQTKLVRCTKGAIFDVAVDIRKGSPSFGHWFGTELSAENKKQLFIPKGFAHGFLTLTDHVEVQYKVDEFYAPKYECGIRWNDPSIGIDWPVDAAPVLSVKDDKAPNLSKANLNFTYGE